MNKSAQDDRENMKGYWSRREALLSSTDRSEADLSTASSGPLRGAGQPRMSLYGRDEEDFEDLDIKLAGRSIIECTPDAEALAIVAMLAEATRGWSTFKPDMIVDLFAGTGNLLWNVGRAVDAQTLGYESNSLVFGCTSHNSERLGLGINLRHASYSSFAIEFSSSRMSGEEGHAESLLFIVDPPWGSAYDPVGGLDLFGTTPSIPDLLEWVRATFGRRQPVHVLLKATEMMPEESRRFLYGLDIRGLRRVGTDSKSPTTTAPTDRHVAVALDIRLRLMSSCLIR